MSITKEKQKEAFAALAKDFGYTSTMQAPRIMKIIVSSGQQDRDVFFGLRFEGKAADTVSAAEQVDHDQALQEALKAINATLLIQPVDGRTSSFVCTLPLSPEVRD